MYKKMYNKVTIGGPESTLGTAVARTDRLPVTDVVDVKQTASKNPSEVLTGRGTKIGNYIDSIEAMMTIPMEFQAIKGIGKLLVSCVGQDLSSPAQVSGAFLISYTGSDASAKLVVNGTTAVMTTGTLGAETADTNFGTGGTYTFATLATDVAAINGYTDYTCEKLFGSDSLATASVGYAITAAQISGSQAVVYFTGTDGVYLHRFVPVLTNTERPTMTMQADGTGLTNDVLAGSVVDSLEVSAELKGRVGLTATVMGTAVSTSTETSVDLLNKKPLKFANGTCYLAGVDQVYVKSINLTVANNTDADDGYGLGSLYKQDHAKGDFAVTGTVSVRSTTTTEVEYAKRITETTSSLLVAFQGDDLATDIPEMVLMNVPYTDILSATKSAGGVSLDSELSIEAIDPPSEYSDVLTIDMLTTDSAAYN